MIDKKIIGEVCKEIIEKDNEELYSKTREELEEYWLFKFDKDVKIAYHYYKFFQALEHYSHYCRRWEEHHNGSVCVVERVRDQYLLPKIRKFIEDIE